MTNAPHLIAERFFHPAPNASPSSRFGLESKGKKRLLFKPSDVQDVLVPTLPQDVATLVGQRLSGLNRRSPLLRVAYNFVSLVKDKSIVCNGRFVDNKVNSYKTEALSNENRLDRAI